MLEVCIGSYLLKSIADMIGFVNRITVYSICNAFRRHHPRPFQSRVEISSGLSLS